MSFTASFGYMMATCAVISIVSIVVYFVTLCRHRQLRTLQSFFISGLFTCDICVVIGDLLRIGLTSGNKSPAVCTLGFIFFNCAIATSFALSSCLVVSVLSLTGTIPKHLQESKRVKVGAILGVLSFSLFYGGIMTYLDVRDGLDDNCSPNFESTVMTWVLWGTTSLFNLASLVFVYLRLRKVMSFSQERHNRVHMRIVATIALMVGCLRIPTFIVGILSSGEISNLLTPDASIGAVIGIFISYALMVLQGFFVVICVTFNQRTACFSYIKVTTSSGSEPASSSGAARTATGKPRLSVTGDRKDSSNAAHEHDEALQVELGEA